jgi:FMN phosphatase YigB (HAD superfamily)
LFDAILFDLDGTLLNLDIDVFLNYYFQEMITAADAQGMSGKELVAQIITATDVMMNSQDGKATNEETFWEAFLKRSDYKMADSQRFFNYFYEYCFPKLQFRCRTFDIAAEIVKEAFKKRTKVAIATNAVFPLQAITERLRWAGIEQYSFDLITSYEIMHYCKPFPEYYLEIADILKVSPQRCLMIGNDSGEDLVAGSTGMKTFLVENMLIERNKGFIPDWHGDIEELYDFLCNGYPK